MAARVATALRQGLDILVVRKLGVPSSPELAFGAIGPGGVVAHNPQVEILLSAIDRARVIEAETAEQAIPYQDPPKEDPR